MDRTGATVPADSLGAASPDGRIEVTLRLDETGGFVYQVDFDGRPLVLPSRLGFELQDVPALDGPFVVLDVETSVVDETWRPLWGAASEVRNHYVEHVVHLQEREAPSRRMDLVFRVFDDGVGFRYVFPEQEALDEMVVMDELTEFRMASGGTAWWIPDDYDSYEKVYNETPVDSVTGANTAMTVRTHEGTHVVIHEADLTDFPGMTLVPIAGAANAFRAGLVPLQGTDGVKAHIETPFATPWRTLTISDRAGGLVESHMILNLNDPCAICDADVSWIAPGKYVGIWWEIHKGVSTWSAGPRLGATTENAKRYIDFASQHGIPYLLVEGWNVGWERRNGWKDMRFTETNPRFDLEEVVAYGDERGVGFIAHMETGSVVDNMEAQLDEAFALYERLGIHAVKTGYVGKVEGHYHHDQWMVNHYQRVVEKAAEHHIMVNAHEPIKPTGKMRTYPNFVTREGVRGMEFNAWSEGNPPSHTLILPFTRMMGGPLDYTPGIFEVLWDPRNENADAGEDQPHYRVHTTRARQLALYPTLLSGIQMVTDLPEHYVDEPAFQFIEDVPVTWDETRVLHASIGDYMTIARRHGEEWYLGSQSTEARTLEVPLDFLGPGAFTATIYSDAPGTDYQTNPMEVAITERSVAAGDVLSISVGAGGGAAIQIMPAR